MDRDTRIDIALYSASAAVFLVIVGAALVLTLLTP